MKTFIHKFNPSLSCTMHIGDAPEGGTAMERQVIWEGKPKPKHLPEYIRWSNEVYRQIANEWGIKIAQVFQLSPSKFEIWEYEPGKAPVRSR